MIDPKQLPNVNTRLLLFFHPLLCALKFVGMRDRLRCPACKAVGTWKPHGGIFDAGPDQEYTERRWLCKWCGFYVRKDIPGMKGWAVLGDRVWEFPPDNETQTTPLKAIIKAFGKRVNPWAG